MKKQTILVFLAAVCVFAGTAAFLWLALWQYSRYTEEEQNKHTFEQALNHSAAVQLGQGSAAPWQMAAAEGFFAHNRTVLLDNQRNQNGAVGMRVLTSLIITPNTSEQTPTEVVVDRGWVARDYAPEYVSQIETPQQKVAVKGLLKPFAVRKEGSLGGPLYGVHPQVVSLAVFAAVPQVAQLNRLPVYLQMAAGEQQQAAAGVAPQPFIEQPKGGGQNFSYMVQWLGFCAVLWGMSAYALFRFLRRTKKK